MTQMSAKYDMFFVGITSLIIIVSVIYRPWHIMLNFYRIMLCSTAHLVGQLCFDLRGKCS